MTGGTPKPQVDTSKPHSARVYDHLLGGKDNYAVDREVAANLPDEARKAARQNRAFMGRAVRWVARQGIDQFLDIGAGIPTEPNLHQIAQEINPKARIVYTDNDPIVLRHAEALMVGTPEGATDYIEADLREPRKILDHAAAFLDFGRPVALTLISVMPFIVDTDDPYGITRTFVDALPAGSHLVLSHGTYDFQPDVGTRIDDAYRGGRIALRARTRAEVERFFEGLDLVDPGVVPIVQWHKDAPAPDDDGSLFYAGVGRVAPE